MSIPPEGPRAGRLVTRTFAHDGGREVSVFVPSGPVEAIIYAGDGAFVAAWGADLEDQRGQNVAELPSTMIVGVHRSADEMARLHEYSPGFEPEKFAEHEELFAVEVPRWIAEEFGVDLPAERTAVLGLSAGGELAMALGLRRPEQYGIILCASPGGGYRPPAVWPRPIPRTYLLAGQHETFFRDNALRWRDALEEAGAEVVIAERSGDHGDPFWREELPEMVRWAFGARG